MAENPQGDLREERYFRARVSQILLARKGGGSVRLLLYLRRQAWVVSENPISRRPGNPPLGQNAKIGALGESISGRVFLVFLSMEFEAEFRLGARARDLNGQNGYAILAKERVEWFQQK